MFHDLELRILSFYNNNNNKKEQIQFWECIVPFISGLYFPTFIKKEWGLKHAQLTLPVPP